jgi:predicted small secreted protein
MKKRLVCIAIIICSFILITGCIETSEFVVLF